MSRRLRVAILIGAGMLLSNFANAQAKIGYIAFNELLQLMPEAKSIQQRMEVYQKEWVDQLKSYNDAYTQKLKDYQAKQATMSDASKATSLADLQAMERHLAELSDTAQKAVSAKADEFTRPLYVKARAAIAAAAKEKGYSYVINTSQTEMVVSQPTDDLMAAVKIKLALK